MSDNVKALIGALTILATAITAYSGGELGSLSGAQRWKAAEQEKLEGYDELLRENAALRLQNRQLLKLIDGATLHIDPEDID